jgi:hypothetical protein
LCFINETKSMSISSNNIDSETYFVNFKNVQCSRPLLYLDSTPCACNIADLPFRSWHQLPIRSTRFYHIILLMFEVTEVCLSGLFDGNMQNNYLLNLHDFDNLHGLVSNLSTVILNTKTNIMTFNHEFIQTKQYNITKSGSTI